MIASYVLAWVLTAGFDRQNMYWRGEYEFDRSDDNTCNATYQYDHHCERVMGKV